MIKWLHLNEEEIQTILSALDFMMDNAAPFDDEDRREFDELIEKLTEIEAGNEIDPDKKYILALPSASQEEVEKTIMALDSFRQDDIHHFIFIYGIDVVIIPMDQIAGYTSLGGGGVGNE